MSDVRKAEHSSARAVWVAPKLVRLEAGRAEIGPPGITNDAGIDYS